MKTSPTDHRSSEHSSESRPAEWCVEEVMTFRKRLVMSSAMMTAVWSYCGYRLRSMSSIRSSNDVAFVSRPKLHFDLEAPIPVRFLQQQIKTPGSRLNAFFVLQDDITKSEDGWIFGDTVLHPTFIELRVSLQIQLFEFDVGHCGAPDEIAKFVWRKNMTTDWIESWCPSSHDGVRGGEIHEITEICDLTCSWSCRCGYYETPADKIRLHAVWTPSGGPYICRLFLCAGFSGQWFSLSVVDAVFRFTGIINVVNQTCLWPHQLQKRSSPRSNSR